MLSMTGVQPVPRDKQRRLSPVQIMNANELIEFNRASYCEAF